MKFHQKRIFCLVLALVALIVLAVPVLVLAADGDPVTVEDNGSRLVARVDESAITAKYPLLSLCLLRGTLRLLAPCRNCHKTACTIPKDLLQ